ncbi:MAG TPA: hypothetical protein VFO15_04860 [Xanthobacteraceae bacterium]|nr:hypothetical protein [Xanthobacteraceae bacterium]
MAVAVKVCDQGFLLRDVSVALGYELPGRGHVSPEGFAVGL